MWTRARQGLYGRPERSGARAQTRGQHALELDLGTHGGLVDVAERAARERAESEGHGERFVVVELKRR